MRYVFEILFLLGIFGIADYHADRFYANKPTGAWFHFLWGCVYFIPAGYVALNLYDGWWMPVAVLLERFVFYNPILNYLRKPRMRFFYLGKSKNSAWWDRIELALKKAYPIVWFVALATFIILQFIK